MHGQTIGASVDLRRTDFYEFAQLRIELGLIDIRLQGSAKIASSLTVS
jgi:hypothetical protein